MLLPLNLCWVCCVFCVEGAGFTGKGDCSGDVNGDVGPEHSMGCVVEALMKWYGTSTGIRVVSFGPR